MIAARRISGALGAEISGVDLSRPLSKADFAEIKRLWLEHLVIFFRDQQLDERQYMAFAGQFGEPVEYPMVRGLAGFPKIIEVKKLEHERVPFGGIWHTDTAYLERPPMASMLIAREIPPVGGDTLFANMYLAFDSLSPGLKKLLEGLKAVNASTKADASMTREDAMKNSGKETKNYSAEHPVVRTHPETGRKALYVNECFTSRIVELDRLESRAVLDFLFRHVERPDFIMRWKWSVNDFAFWDNRAVQHYAVPDYQTSRRMSRVVLAGEKPGSPTRLAPRRKQS